MLTKKDLTNLIIRTPRPDYWRLSFDYFHPIPDRDWGQPTGTEKKWAHEGKFLTNWIESAKLSDKPRNKEQKEAKKKQREEYRKEKMKVLKEIIGNTSQSVNNEPLVNTTVNQFDRFFHEPSEQEEELVYGRYSPIMQNEAHSIEPFPGQEDIYTGASSSSGFRSEERTIKYYLGEYGKSQNPKNIQTFIELRDQLKNDNPSGYYTTQYILENYGDHFVDKKRRRNNFSD